MMQSAGETCSNCAVDCHACGDGCCDAAAGETCVTCAADCHTCGDNIREGVVVRPAVERRDPALGRVVLKFISPEYDLSKHKKKDTTDL